MGFLGLIAMNKDVFLCVISGRMEVAAPLKNERINRIYDVEFHCLTSDKWDFVDLNNNGYPIVPEDESVPGAYNQKLEQHPCYELRKILSDGSFYYSTDFDLTSTLQGRGVHETRQMSMDRFHLDYMWNAFMMKEIIHFRNNLDDEPKQALDSNHFLTTVIRGFAKSVHTSIDGHAASMAIISKQSWKRTGTRFNVRGVDDDGNVANFVETELILNDGYHAFAYTQIRGSIPLFWEQDTALVSPKVQITRGFDASQPIFEEHFANLNGKYGPVHIVNLLSKTKSSEVTLSREYKKHYKVLEQKKPDSVFFTDFDFHQETARSYADADRILRYLHESLEDFGYFCYDLKAKETIMEQQGVFRTNCLDCLDRTNVIQQVISLAALDQYLSDFKKGSRSVSGIHSKHSVLWADHGDQISQIYTGTNALKSSFSRSGKMGFAGALSDATKSLSRIYINNFVDKGKQVVIDTLLGKNSDQIRVKIFDPVTEWLAKKMHEAESQYTLYHDISMFVGTFNLAGAPSGTDLSTWLFPSEVLHSPPEIYVVGFQEVIELNASNILKNDGSAGQYWKNATERCLNSGSGPHYMLLRSEYMSSILILMFVREDKMKFVTQVEGKSKKTGMGGMTANKGSVAIRFCYGSTSFCVFNSHLASGTTNVEERFNDFLTSWNGIRFSRNRLIQHHDNVIWMGDLNYRVSLPNEEARTLIMANNLPKLLTFDQLSYERKRHPEFQGFIELPITFPPTYKFDKGSDSYDTSEKQRVPSWTDRIMFKSTQLSQLCYHCVPDIRFSDHRPVFGTFCAHVKVVNSDRKHTLTRHFLQEYKSGANKASENVIELNADSDGSEYGDWASPTADQPTLIDLSGESNAKPRSLIDTKRSSVPPPKANQAYPAIPLSGLSSLKSSGTSSSSSSFSVMKPTKSRDGSPAPALPPRSNTAPRVYPKLSRRPVPPLPRKSNVNHETSIKVNPDTTKENAKIPPIVPAKPESLDLMFKGSSSAQDVNQKWAPMAPTRHR